MPTSLPEVNDLVQLVLPDRAESLPSRVQDRDGDTYVLDAPSYRGDLEEPLPGTELLVTWTGLRGRYELEVELTEIVRQPLRLWRANLAGAPRLSQRRDFARAEVSLPLTLTPTGREEAEATTGTTIDVSEGGMRCRVRGLKDAVAAEPVRAELALEDGPIVAHGSVVRVIAATDLVTELAVRLELPEPAARRIRRLVLDQQRLARRMRS